MSGFLPVQRNRPGSRSSASDRLSNNRAISESWRLVPPVSRRRDLGDLAPLPFAKPTQEQRVPFSQVREQVANGPAVTPNAGLGVPGHRNIPQEASQSVVLHGDILEQLALRMVSQTRNLTRVVVG